jgi:decaprenyl-phosphate phosphoribosyltransferase
MKIASMIKLMRINQYIKNLFIFLPIFFAMKITEVGLLVDALVAFIAFSLTASAIYILNDYLDVNEDRLHPEKKERPIASNAINKTQAIVFMFILLCLGFTLMTWLSLQAAGILLAYVLLNIAYSFSLKSISILDVNIISIGFVLRLFIGSVVTGIHLSKWIIIMTFLLALFIAFAKRRDDVLIFLDTGKTMRKVVDGYNLQFLDTAMSIMASVVIVSYMLYTTSSDVEIRLNNEYLYLTTIFVILGFLRYLKITFIHKNSGSPTKILNTDRFMQLIIIGWAITFTWILYQ